jgi:hypothetical protein
MHHQREWLPLVGQEVAIRFDTKTVRTGIVDAVTADDHILWITAQGSDPRRMFQRTDGFSVWIEYKWDTSQPPN